MNLMQHLIQSQCIRWIGEEILWMNNEFLARYSSAILAYKIQCINVFKLRKEASEIMKDHNMKPEHLRTLDNAFKVLMEFPTSRSGMSLITDTLHECFGDDFSGSIVSTQPDVPLFVMSIFPERSTTDKIIESVARGNSDFKTIQSLWEKNTKWTIEIDERILKNTFTTRELTAMVLHEVGHLIQSKTIATRIVTVLQYEYAKTSMQNKMLLRTKVFRSIMALPIINSCISDQKGSNVKDEIKADRYAKKLGYAKDLISAMNKLSKLPNYNLKKDPNEAMRSTTQFSLNTLQNLQDRKNDLVKSELTTLKEAVQSPYLESVLVDIYGQWFVDKSAYTESSQLDYFVRENNKSQFIDRMMKESAESYMREFGIFGKKKLQRIDPADIDYISLKIDQISSDLDKMMLVSYIHNKMDMVNFYLDLLDDPRSGKKYNVPHSRSYLLSVQKQLEMLREKALKKIIPPKQPDIYVGYPAGYEG